MAHLPVDSKHQATAPLAAAPAHLPIDHKHQPPAALPESSAESNKPLPQTTEAANGTKCKALLVELMRSWIQRDPTLGANMEFVNKFYRLLEQIEAVEAQLKKEQEASAACEAVAAARSPVGGLAVAQLTDEEKEKRAKRNARKRKNKKDKAIQVAAAKEVLTQDAPK